MTNKKFKFTLQILIILIFNNFLAQTSPKKIEENKGKKDTVVVVNEQLEDILLTKADNSRFDVEKKMTFLNKNAQINYQDMQIDADYISIDWEGGTIFARGMIDSSGKITKPAVATQGGKKYEYNEVSYNYKTRQAIAYNARTEENEGAIVAEKTKKVNDSVFYMRRGFFTTDELFRAKKDTLPDYHLSAPILKLVKGKNSGKVVTGPIQLYIEQVPTPLALPFAILPFTEKRSAGLIIPSFGERADVGFYFNGLGYYQPLGKHFDLKILTDYYTKGSWNIRPEVNYKKNYKYSGTFRGDIGTTIRGIKGLDSYSKSSTYRIYWTHQQDAKANPFLQLSASVDVVSNRFYNNNINNSYIFNQDVLNAQQNSSITLTKRFLNFPVTLTGNLSYSQNFSTGLTNLRLPSLTASVNQFYLFKAKDGVRKGLIENITVNTKFDFRNEINAQQNEMFTNAMWDKMKSGARNVSTFSTTTTFLRYFNLSLSASADNVLTNKTIRKNYNSATNAVETTDVKGITGFSTFNTSASVQTTLYGMLKFGKNSKIQAVRHVFTPSIGFSYNPDFSSESWGYYQKYIDATGNPISYSIFENGVYGSPSVGLSKSITFNFNNNIEMKVKSKKDSTGVTKIKLFENIGVNFSYNAAAPTFKWSYININAQNSFFNNKLSLNYNASFDPYKIVFTPSSEIGTRLDKLGYFRLQYFNLGANLSLHEILKPKNKEKKTYHKKGYAMMEAYHFDDDNYARFDQDWTMSITANYSYNNSAKRYGDRTASIGLNGSIKLTPYWNITGSAHYDLVNKAFSYSRLGFARDQRSFTITFNWVPIGQYKVYDFFIGIKANILKDALKYKTQSFPQSTSSF
ncbi:MAG: LPS-assembly protein LptD [Flavobacteriaceae bacterium]|nr:LPS-assembly protein LptD [Flavobacteriaceae bacterium]